MKTKPANLPKLLIIDDDEDIRSQMKWGLGGDYAVLEAGDRPSAIEIFQEHSPPVVLLDLGLPPHPGTPAEGLAAMSEFLEIDPYSKIIVISGQSERPNALAAVGQGAYDFLPKPVEMEELRVILRRAYYLAELEANYHEAQRRLAMDTDAFEGMLGTSPQMQSVFTAIRKVAGSSAPVLILGESGTGKERAARAIHSQSPRRNAPFVVINCGAIPENLLESELFGHEKGSFTGAHTQRLGKIESAEGGTLFLDEVGELSPALQVKLLRYLQEQTIERVGGRQELTVDARIIAATNADLKDAMEADRFREDLYYRLAVVVVELPPLRRRENDILYLAHAFLKRFAGEHDVPTPRLAKAAREAMLRYQWPGNIRELENRVKRAVLMHEGRSISPADLELHEPEAADTTPATIKAAREATERELITRALKKYHGKITPTAQELGISRPTLYELMEKLGIQR